LSRRAIQAFGILTAACLLIAHSAVLAQPADGPALARPDQAESPQAESPKAEAPPAEAPTAEVPKAEAPAAEAPKSGSPKAEAPKAEAPKNGGRKAEAAKPARAGATKTARVEAQGQIEMNFRNVELLNFLQLMSQSMGVPMLYDEREIKGKITLVSPRKFSKEDAYRIFDTILDMQGFAIIRKDDSQLVQIVQAKDAARFPTQIRTAKDAAAESGYITQIIPLKFADANQIKAALQPIMSRTASLAVYLPANLLILSDTQENVARFLGLVKELDIAPGDIEFVIVTLKNSSARRMATLMASIVGPSQPGQPARRLTPQGVPTGLPDVKVVADERTNSLILVGDSYSIQKMRELLDTLDVPGLTQDTGIRVFRLQHADAEDLVKILRDVRIPQVSTDPRAQPGVPVQPGIPQQPGLPGQAFPGASSITADKSTNALIVFGTADFIQTLEEVVKQLDVRRPQVFVQALIMEVTLDKSLDLGVHWQAASPQGDNVIGSGFPSAAPQTLPNVLAAGSGAVAGIVGNEIQYQGQKFVSFSAFIQATRQDQDLNVLANPQLLTLNNEEAEINVSQVIPVSAKVVTNVNNQTTSEFEFKDVGIILKIKPQITGDDKVRLIINQESSSVASRQAVAATTQQAITTLKRKINTRVLVDDGATVAIGGLIQDQQVLTETKVPCLGDVPVLGWFFKSRSESMRKTNLIVFIRPQIIHTREESEAATREAQERYDAGRDVRENTGEALRKQFELAPGSAK
jgi:general secretion pathway protein D